MGLAGPLEIYHTPGMTFPTDAVLLEQIEQFLTKTKMKPSRLGLEAIADGALVFQLREGRRSLTLKSAEKIVNYMTAYEAAKAAIDASASRT
jgi:hypothetical protein